MGIFDSIRVFSSIKKSKFIVYASNKHLKEGNMPIGEIFDFITKHKDLSKIAKEFTATRGDIENIVPIRLSPIPTTSRVLPIPRVKLGLGRAAMSSAS